MKKNKWINYYFYTIPFIDMITALITRHTSFLITPGIIIKTLLILYLIFYIFTTSSKYKKISIITLLIIIFYIINYFIFKPFLINSSFILKELQFIFKLIFFPITFLGFLCYFDEQNIKKVNINNILKITLIIYLFLLVVPQILGLAYTTYPAHLKGYIGWFYAGNEIANIMILLSPAAYLFINKNKYSYLSIIPIFYIILTIGTKVSMLASLIIVFITLIYFLLKKDKKNIFKSSIIFIITIFLSINSYATYNTKYIIDKNLDIKEEIIIEQEHKEEINEITNKLSNYLEKNNFTKIFKVLLSGRDELLANTISVYNDEKSANNIWFGIGFSNAEHINNQNISRLVEIDICDGFFHYGIIGLLIMFSPFIICIYLIILNYKKISLNKIYYILIILLILGISTFSGHVLIAPAVSTYLVLYLILLLNEYNLLKKEDKKPQKIAILSLHLGYGGIERSIINKANMLSQNYNVEIITLYKLEKNIPYEINKNVTIKYLTNLKPNKTEIKNAINKKNIINIIKEGCKAIYILFQKKYKTINYIYNSDAKIIISTRIYFTKLLNKYGDYETIKIAEEHVYHNNNCKYIKKLRNSLTNINYLIPASQYLTSDYQKHFEKDNVKIVYIPQTIKNIQDKPNKLDNLNVISVGRLSKEKGFVDLIEVFNIISKTNPKIKLTLVGDGDEKNEILKKIKEYQLSNITLTGFLNSKELDKIYKTASLFVMTSLEESFGLVLLEAMSYGVPCLAFDRALGAKEIINSKNGKLISNGNINKMAKTIINYFNEKDHEKMQENALITAQKYTYENVSETLNKFIKDILGENK